MTSLQATLHLPGGVPKGRVQQNCALPQASAEAPGLGTLRALPGRLACLCLGVLPEQHPASAPGAAGKRLGACSLCRLLPAREAAPAPRGSCATGSSAASLCCRRPGRGEGTRRPGAAGGCWHHSVAGATGQRFGSSQVARTASVRSSSLNATVLMQYASQAGLSHAGYHPESPASKSIPRVPG